MEIRTLSGAEVRATAGRLEGYAAVFGQWSEDLGGFREKIERGAFSRALAERQDVACLVNHNQTEILGRTRSGTLRLAEDGTGLRFSCLLGGSPLAAHIHEAVARGDISGCSFGFRAKHDAWSTDRSERTLIDADLFDVGPVTSPAYPQTTVVARSSVQPIETRGRYVFRKGVYLPGEEELETERRRALTRLARLEISMDEERRYA